MSSDAVHVAGALISQSELAKSSPWHEIYALYQSRRKNVYRFARSITKNHHDAEDATQEAFVRLYEEAQRQSDRVGKHGGQKSHSGAVSGHKPRGDNRLGGLPRS